MARSNKQLKKKSDVESTSECEYCNKPVDYPLPIHPECAAIWLKGWNAREMQLLQERERLNDGNIE